MMNAKMLITSKIANTENNISELSFYQMAKNISFVEDKALVGELLQIINCGKCNYKSLVNLLNNHYQLSNPIIRSVCFRVDMEALPIYTSSYANEEIGYQLNDVKNHLYLENPMLSAKKISVEFELKSIDKKFIVSSYKVFINDVFIVESQFDHANKQAFIKHLNYLHPLLVDQYHHEWLEFEFEDGSPLHTGLMKNATQQQLDFNFNNEFGTFEEQFEDGGFRSKLDMYLRNRTIKFWNTNSAIPNLNQAVEICSIHEADSHIEVNKKVLTDVLSNLLVAPLDNLNWMLNQFLNEKLSA